MAWADYGTEFSDQCAEAGLSDAAYRVHREAIDWLYRSEQSSCRIPKRIVSRLPGDRRRRVGALKELLNATFWKQFGDTFEVVHHAEVVRESLARQIHAREQARVRQQAKRARDRGAGDG
jgi:hypothetical protein